MILPDGLMGLTEDSRVKLLWNLCSLAYVSPSIHDRTRPLGHAIHDDMTRVCNSFLPLTLRNQGAHLQGY